MARFGAAFGASIFFGAFVAAAGCGSGGDGSTFGNNGDNNLTGSSGGTSGFSSGGTSGGNAGCTGLQCKQVNCAGGATTTLTGTVFTPAGDIPLYNAVVYVPNAALDAFPAGVTCDRCGTTPSGQPITTALTDSSGKFSLTNVPVGVDVPLVIQIGKWRRQVVVPAASVAQCAESPVDAALTRLPRNKTEGDIPQIAISTGGADSLECFLRKLGIDDSEFTNPDGAGRVHFYQGLRTNNNGSSIDGSTPSSNTLWDDPAELAKHDIVILSCEGDENNTTKSAAARQNLGDYMNAGGRVFASHFHYTWIKNDPTAGSQLPVTASWVNNGDVSGSPTINVDTSFAKGQAFSDWLVVAGASDPASPGTFTATELKRNVTSVPGSGMDASTSTRWLYLKKGGAEDPKFYSFNTPIGTPAASQCGRTVYTDIHVSSGDASGGTWPGNCTTTGMTSQEKALLFLMMDLASCIQDDSQPPTAPPPAVH